jgi:hypothetical protein
MTDRRWFAAQYEVGQREQQEIFAALHRFRDLEQTDLPAGEEGILWLTRRREVEVAIEAAITAYEGATSKD